MKTILFLLLAFCALSCFAQINLKALPIRKDTGQNLWHIERDTTPVKLGISKYKPVAVPDGFFDAISDSELSYMRCTDSTLAKLSKMDAVDTCYMRKLKAFCKTDNPLTELALQKCVELWYEREREFGNKPEISYFFTKADLKELVENAMDLIIDKLVQEQ